MRQMLIATLLLLWMLPVTAPASVHLHPTPEIGDIDTPSSGPVDAQMKVLAALQRNDSAALIDSMGPRALQEFLSEGSELSADEIAAKIASAAPNESADELVRLWVTLAKPDGVALVSTEWYPIWQAQVPQALAAAQMSLLGIREELAKDTDMAPADRMQLTELQWAITGWLARTDFADRKHFEQLLGLARELIIASGKAHPLEMLSLSPEKRLQLADKALRSTKTAVALYGLDAQQILDSMQLKTERTDPDTALIRFSMKMLNVPLRFEKALVWYDGRWVDAELRARMQAYSVEQDAIDSDESTAAADEDF